MHDRAIELLRNLIDQGCKITNKHGDKVCFCCFCPQEPELIACHMPWCWFSGVQAFLKEIDGKGDK